CSRPAHVAGHQVAPNPAPSTSQQPQDCQAQDMSISIGQTRTLLTDEDQVLRVPLSATLSVTASRPCSGIGSVQVTRADGQVEGADSLLWTGSNTWLAVESGVARLGVYRPMCAGMLGCYGGVAVVSGATIDVG